MIWRTPRGTNSRSATIAGLDDAPRGPRQFSRSSAPSSRGSSCAAARLFPSRSPTTSAFAPRPRWSSVPIGVRSSSPETSAAQDEAIDRDYWRAARIARPEEEAYRQALLHEPDTLAIDRGRFLAAVKAQLAPALERASRSRRSTSGATTRRSARGPLVTLIDVGGSGRHQLAYSHTLRSVGVETAARGHVTLRMASGIGGAHTTWNQLTQADTADAARALARVCAHFVQAMPRIGRRARAGLARRATDRGRSDVRCSSIARTPSRASALARARRATSVEILVLEPLAQRDRTGRMIDFIPASESGALPAIARAIS